MQQYFYRQQSLRRRTYTQRSEVHLLRLPAILHRQLFPNSCHLSDRKRVRYHRSPEFPFQIPYHKMGISFSVSRCQRQLHRHSTGICIPVKNSCVIPPCFRTEDGAFAIRFFRFGTIVDNGLRPFCTAALTEFSLICRTTEWAVPTLCDSTILYGSIGRHSGIAWCNTF